MGRGLFFCIFIKNKLLGCVHTKVRRCESPVVRCAAALASDRRQGLVRNGREMLPFHRSVTSGVNAALNSWTPGFFLGHFTVSLCGYLTKKLCVFRLFGRPKMQK